MTQNLSDDLRRDRRYAARKYSASVMSNAKWRFFFSVLSKDEFCIRQLMVKFTDSPKPKVMQGPWLHAPWEFADSFEFGPFPLVGIEWIVVPATASLPRAANVPPQKFPQDAEGVYGELLASGKRFPMELTSAGLRVTGHIR